MRWLKKCLFIVYLYSISVIANCQTTTGNSNTTLLSPPSNFVPAKTIASPEAFKFPTYGNNSIGLSTGSIQYNYPIFQINTGKLSHAISVDYTSNGVKLTENSSRVGFGWNLSAGGVITKSVRDKPDEFHIPMRYNRTNGESDTSLAFYNFIRNSSLSSHDYEPDIYSFRAGSLSGKFYFDISGNVIHLERTKVKVERYSGKFLITDINGDKYYFEEGETSRSYDYLTDGTNAPLPDFLQSAWFLTKIVSANSKDSIGFVYTDVNGSTPLLYFTSIEQSYATILSDYSYRYMDNSGGIIVQDACLDNASYFQTRQIKTESYAKLLDKIVFPEGEVLFKYSSRTDIPGEKRLDTILIKNYNGEFVSAKSFTYQLITSNSSVDISNSIISSNPILKQRIFLTKIENISRDNQTKETTVFSYDDPQSLPARFSFSQDLFGTFNGVNNAYLFPKGTYLSQFGVNIGAERRYDFNYAKKGVLNKITYPTGGFTLYSFEPNNVLGNIVYTDSSILSNYSINNQTNYNVVIYSDTFMLNTSRNIQIDATCNWSNGVPDYFPESYYGELTIQAFENGTWIDKQIYYIFPDQNLSWNANSNPSITGNCRVKLFSYQPGINLSLILNKPVQVIAANNFQGIAGIRVREVADYSENNVVSNKRTFYYRSWENPASSGSGIDLNPGLKNHVTVVRTLGSRTRNHSSQNNLNEIYCGYNLINSSPIYGGYLNSSQTLNYSSVIESKVDGVGKIVGTEYKFIVANATEPRTYSSNYPSHVWFFSPVKTSGTPLSNNDYFIGRMSKVIDFSANVLFSDRMIFEEKEFYYSLDVPSLKIDTINSSREVINRARVPSWKYFSDYDINYYLLYSYWIKNDSIITRSYLQNMASPLVQKTSFKYSPYNHLKRTEVFVTSKGDARNKTNYYTSDIDKYGSLYSDFVNKNNLALSVEGIDSLNNQQLFQRKILYKNWGVFWDIQYLTSKVKSFTVDTSLIVLSYDSRGNVNSYIESDGVVVSILWGYRNSVPVAIVRGVNISTLQSAVNLNIINNPSSFAQMKLELLKIHNISNIKSYQISAYNPLIGIIWQTDNTQNENYYEYDSFNRLKMVKDKHGNILKMYCYNYFGNLISCN